MPGQTEDAPYTHIDDFALDDESNEGTVAADEDQTAETTVIKEIRAYLKKAIKEHNTLDVVHPEAENTMTTQQQVTMHKQVVIHLRNIQQMINSKVKEN